MRPLESRPQTARILTFRKFKRICRLHLNRVPFVSTLSVTAAFLGLTPVFYQRSGKGLETREFLT